MAQVERECSIADYGLIGNCRAAALVSRNGSIDWCCIPDFDSPSIFAALLDTDKGGRFKIAPSATHETSQSYLPDTNVLETHFTTQEGRVHLTDCFVTMSENQKTHSLFPDHEILRIVEGIAGSVSIDLEYSPTTYYGRYHPRLEDEKKLGLRFSWKENTYVLATTLEPGAIKISESANTAFAEFRINAGERVIFSLSHSCQNPAVLVELETTGYSRMQNTVTYWKHWVSQCTYSGLYHHHVKRSALALKLLAYAPSGAIIAAPTTSLPEAPGEDRNWDYRYCWLRDASFTIRALVNLGFEHEAHAYMSWILHATQLTRPELQVVYTIFGDAKLKEQTLDWLSGYKKSTPVRIGNSADRQFQLDVYGEVLDAVYTYSPLVKEFDRHSKKFILALGKVICKSWNQPDNGIWEIRSSCIHHTHSKVMAWVGLDRLIKLCKKYQWSAAEVQTFKRNADLIRQEVEASGFNTELNSYTRELKGSDVDASLLVLSLVGFCEAGSPAMVSTTNLICERLSKNNLIYRYRDIEDGLQGQEGSFGICNFWLAENFAKSGRLEKAMEVFDMMLHHASPTGLLSEEIEPDTHQLLGNYPQGFTHIGLINAAISINEEHLKLDAFKR